MNFLGAVLVLAASLMLEAALGRWVPQAQRYVDVMTWPIAWTALAGSQRSAMITGCAAGLLQDAWFQAGAFGIHGFSKTLLGFTLGGVGSRFDLNHFWGQCAGGALLLVGDRLLETALLLLLDQGVTPLRPAELALGALVNGLLVTAFFAIVHRGTSRRRAVGLSRRRA